MSKELEYIKTGYSRFDDISSYKKVNYTDEILSLIQETLENVEYYDHWYSKKGELYYLKELDDIIKFYNELIGSEMSRYMGLPTIEYGLIENNHELIGLISKNFKDPNFKYEKSYNLLPDEKEKINRIVFSETDCDQEYKRLLTLYLFNNFYIDLKDRRNNSLYTLNNEGNIGMAPVYDFGFAFEDDKSCYYSDPLISCMFDEEVINGLLNTNEYTKEALEKLSDLNILSIIRIIDGKYNINTPKIVRDVYKKYEDKRKKFLIKNKIMR